MLDERQYIIERLTYWAGKAPDHKIHFGGTFLPPLSPKEILYHVKARTPIGDHLVEKMLTSALAIICS